MEKLEISMLKLEVKHQVIVSLADIRNSQFFYIDAPKTFN